MSSPASVLGENDRHAEMHTPREREQTRERRCEHGRARDTGDESLIPGLGRSPGEGNGNPLQYSCLGNAMDGGAWQATVHRVAKSQT